MMLRINIVVNQNVGSMNFAENAKQNAGKENHALTNLKGTNG